MIVHSSPPFRIRQSAGLFALAGLMLLAVSSQAATLLEETFDGLAPALRAAADESIPASVLGWTCTPPSGWSVDSENMDTSVGVTEWRGWSFTTMDFWPRTDAQGRERFSLAEGVLAIAESDEYDDKDNPPAFDSTLVSPAIRVPGGRRAYVQWDNMCWSVSFEYVCQLVASIDGGPDVVVVDYRGRNRSNTQEVAKIEPPETGADWRLVLKWRYQAKNGWFWGIDNVRVTDEPPPPPPPLSPLADARDWPAFRRDTRRTANAPKAPHLPLAETWVHSAAHAPSPAWPPPAQQDIAHSVRELSPTHVFDRAFHVVAVGQRVYYGSSADDALYCLDAASGAPVWSFLTGGGVRFAPTVTQGRVYLGSDDGCVYCLSAEDGALLWKHRPTPDRRLPGNGRMISRWPIRSGIALADGVAYFTAGIFPSEGVFLCALDAQSGTPLWKREIGVSSQGYMLASSTKLFVPTGRTAPAAFIRENGKPLGGFEGIGGCFALVLDDMLVQGPGERGDLHIAEPRTRESIVSAPGIGLVADGPTVYILQRDALVAFDRARYLELSTAIHAIEAIDGSKRTDTQNAALIELNKQRRACQKWQVPCSSPREIIKAGDLLFVGRANAVSAFHTSDGALRWNADVRGIAYGLAIGRGRLFVSTDQGAIHCFSHRTARTARTAHQATATAAPFADDEWTARYQDAADRIMRQCETKRGYCLVLASKTGRLAYEIAKRSQLAIVGIEPDADAAARARRYLHTAGLNGTRVAIHNAPADTLPFPDYFANLVVSEETLSTGHPPATPATEVLRVLRPCGGTVCLIGSDAAALSEWGKGVLPDWQVVDGMALACRGPLQGVGEWTHTYAEPGNSACSGDRLVRPPFQVQWYGEPGPRRMADRHFRNVPPLYKNGRLFVPGDQVVYTLDAYNGTLLWQTEIQDSRRLGVFLDSSNMTVDEHALYVVAQHTCHVFDVNSGEKRPPFDMPKTHAQDREWGYLARVPGLLLGTARPKGVTYATMTRNANLNKQAVWYPNMKIATSETAFALDSSTGALRWDYAGGRIIDTTATVAADRFCFVESHSTAALADQTGRLTVRALTQDGEQYLVALDLATGAPVFKNPLAIRDLQQPAYLSYTDGVLLLSGAKLVGGEHVVSGGRKGRYELRGGEVIHYFYFAFDAHTGHALWQTSHPTELPADGGHGEYNRHPTLVGDTAYCWPYAYNIKTGQRIPDWKFDRHGHGCGGISASADALFWRGNTAWAWDLRPGRGPSPVSATVRPGCWINMIPAGGLHLMPEASAGCTCGYSVQTSIALAPCEPAP